MNHEVFLLLFFYVDYYVYSFMDIFKKKNKYVALYAVKSE